MYNNIDFSILDDDSLAVPSKKLHTWDDFQNEIDDQAVGQSGSFLGDAIKGLLDGLDPESYESIWPTIDYEAYKLHREHGTPLPKDYWRSKPLSSRFNKDVKFEYFSDQFHTVINDFQTEWTLLRGGEGSGKTALACMWMLYRVSLGNEGIVVAPTFSSIKKSAWNVYRDWIPESAVIPEHRNKLKPSYNPTTWFTVIFNNKSGGQTKLSFMGAKDPDALDGQNVTYAHIDEAKDFETEKIVENVQGRTRMVGPNGEKPQSIISSIPKKNWLYDYFGNLDEDDEEYDPSYKRKDDKKLDFKSTAKDYRFSTKVNFTLYTGFYEARAKGLSQKKVNEKLEGYWVDHDEDGGFLESDTHWSRLGLEEDVKRKLLISDGKLLNSIRCVAGFDVSTKRDSTGFVIVSRHPDNENQTVVLEAIEWRPEDFSEGVIQFDVIKKDILEVCKKYNIICISYDEYQAESLCQDLRKNHDIWTDSFGQNKPRTLADSKLFDMIYDKNIFHLGQKNLKDHMCNAGRKETNEGGKRLVKKHQSQKIDLSVALSMANYRLHELMTY